MDTPDGAADVAADRAARLHLRAACALAREQEPRDGDGARARRLAASL